MIPPGGGEVGARDVQRRCLGPRKGDRLCRPEYRPLPDQPFLYEAPERFGESLTTNRPWNTTALAAVERLNGRVAMLGFVAAIVGELISGHGPAGQVWALLRWTIR